MKVLVCLSLVWCGGVVGCCSTLKLVTQVDVSEESCGVDQTSSWKFAEAGLCFGGLSLSVQQGDAVPELEAKGGFPELLKLV